MKRCPTCYQVYRDDALKFCRLDGAVLTSYATDFQQTLIRLPAPGDGADGTGTIRPAPAMPRLSQVTFGETIEEYPAWSPGDDKIAFSREEEGIRSIFIKDVASGEERRLTRGDYDDIQPSLSPDGNTVLFVRAKQPKVKLEPGDVFGVFIEGDVWAVDLRTRKERRLIKNAFNPDYSPDGRRIAFDASWAGPRRIWAVDHRGHNPQQLTSDVSEGVSHVRPRWSPDGTRIVFQNIERTKFDVRVFDLSDGSSWWITNDAVQDLNPVWSPSGRFIYFSSYRGGGINIWRVALPGGGAPQQLTIGAGQDVETAISRDGKRLAFAIHQTERRHLALAGVARDGTACRPPTGGHHHDSRGQPGGLVSGRQRHRLQLR